MGVRERDVLEALDLVDPASEHGLESAVELVRELIGATSAVAYRPEWQPPGWSVEFVAGAGFRKLDLPSVWASGFQRTQLERYGLFDPRHPELEQRNRALRCKDLALDDFCDLRPPMEELFRNVGVYGHDQLRVLLCDGAKLLAWVGGWREEPFTVAERERLGGAVEALRRRVGLETALLNARLLGPALETALDALPAPAMLFSGTRLMHRNATTTRLLRSDPELVGRALKALRAPSAEFDLHVIETPGLPRHVLVLGRGAHHDFEARLVEYTEQHALTARQTDVARLLLDGRSNKEIAELLAVTVGTAELHVAAVLRKTGVGTRSRLLAAFWGHARPPSQRPTEAG